MSTSAFDIWAENPRDFRLGPIKKWDAVLKKYVIDDTLVDLTAFLATTNGPTATLANAAFTLTAVSLGRGKYQAKFTRTQLANANFTAASINDGDTIYLIWDGPNDLRVEQPLIYHASRPAA